MSNNNLSPDEKQVLLFNVKDTFEIAEEEFNNNWWPLISNVWTQYNSCKFSNGDSWKIFICRFTKHQESSTRKDDVLNNKRRTTLIRLFGFCKAKIKIIQLVFDKLVRIECYKNSPDHVHTLIETAIVKTVKEYTNNKLQLDESIKDLKCREVANIKYKLREPMETHLVDNVELESDILETILYLKNQDYYCEHYYILQKFTNDHYGCWDVGAHFFISTEDSDTIAEVLKIIRNICKNWTPVYILMD
ncbi:hypothetical protein Glove_514g4 [Diversispora epigaea]|uniref:MULE transposase domain-containing protein n=1 Tax=Diversispora epigaea TaxID=1348612 RepID=A0A397GH10_9GLOM|nr:hypothetical protein Glove_514g4 [Diversispora epigaea]